MKSKNLVLLRNKKKQVLASSLQGINGDWWESLYSWLAFFFLYNFFLISILIGLIYYCRIKVKVLFFFYCRMEVRVYFWLPNILNESITGSTWTYLRSKSIHQGLKLKLIGFLLLVHHHLLCVGERNIKYAHLTLKVSFMKSPL